VITSHFTTFSV